MASAKAHPGILVRKGPRNPGAPPSRSGHRLTWRTDTSGQDRWVGGLAGTAAAGAAVAVGAGAFWEESGDADDWQAVKFTRRRDSWNGLCSM